MTDRPAGSAPPGVGAGPLGGEPGTGSLLDGASEVWQAARARLGRTVDLAAAEAELAARAGAGILILAALAIVAVLTGWGFLVAALASLAVAAGLPWSAVAAGLSLLHFAIAAGLLKAAALLSRDLTLPALRRALRGD